MATVGASIVGTVVFLFHSVLGITTLGARGALHIIVIAIGTILGAAHTGVGTWAGTVVVITTAGTVVVFAAPLT
jgi:hypothetical protein